MADSSRSTTSPWWGDFAIPEGKAGAFDIGPLEMRVMRARHEWRISIERVPDAPGGRSDVRIPVEPEEPRPGAAVSRIAFRETNELLRLRPALPDRALVVAPGERFGVAPSEDLTFYIRVPVRVQVFAGDPPDPPALLREAATVRLRDTWSGPSFREGELAYASAETTFEPPQGRAPGSHEAVCALRVINRAMRLLPLDEIRVPLPHIALFADDSNRLWTQSVVLERSADGDLAEMRVLDHPPHEAEPVKRVGEPRFVAERSRIVQIFGKLLGSGREDS